MATPLKFETLQLHAGSSKDPTTGARAVPIYQTASFEFDSSAHGAAIFDMSVPGFLYSRISNPTTAVFEERMAALEGGIGAVACSSGQAAMFMSVCAIAMTGDNIIASSYLYGGSFNLFKVFFKKFGIEFKFVEGDDLKAFEAQIDENTKGIYLESIGNPSYAVFDLQKYADLAHSHKIPLLVDNTFGAGGYIIRPIDHGADIVIHSATKWIGGHGTTIAGIIIDSGNFDWAASGKFPGYTEPSEGFHGLIYSEKFGRKAFVTKVRIEVLKDMGACLSPQSSFLMLQGIETLSLRVERHCQNTLALALWLEKHPSIAWVSYPGLSSHPYHGIASRILRKGHYGGVLSFGVKGDIKLGSLVCDKLKIASNLANVGDCKTLVIHPATTTHQQLNNEEQLKAGLRPEMIRVSCGIEHIDDVIEDFRQAFIAAGVLTKVESGDY